MNDTLEPTRAYKCTGMEKISATNDVVPVFAPNITSPLEPDMDCEVNLEDCFQLLSSGSTIKGIFDCPKHSKHQRPKRVLQLKSNNSSLHEFCLSRHYNGPIKRYSLVSFNNSDVLYFSDDSHVILVHSRSNMPINSPITTMFDICYANLRTKETKNYTFNGLNFVGLGSHIIVTHGAQLFICYDNPIQLYMIDFKTLQFYQWNSPGSASRFLTCANFVVILDNHNLPEMFTCVTFAGTSVYENLIKKPEMFLGKDKYELPMILNVRKSVYWVAHNEDVLVLLKIQTWRLQVVKKFHFNSGSNNTNRMNVLIKSMLCLKNHLLLVPMIGIDKNTIGSDCSADGYQLVVVDLYDVDILYILRSYCKVDIYTDMIDICPLDHGNSVVVKLMKKNVKPCCNASYQHVFHLKPCSLKDISLNFLIDTFTYGSVKDVCPVNIDLSQFYSC